MRKFSPGLDYYTRLKCAKRCAFLPVETEPPVPLKGLQLQMLQFHQVCQQQPTFDAMPWLLGHANLPETNFTSIADKHLLLSMLHWLTCICHSSILLSMVHFYWACNVLLLCCCIHFVYISVLPWKTVNASGTPTGAVTSSCSIRSFAWAVSTTLEVSTVSYAGWATSEMLLQSWTMKMCA